MTRRYRIYAGVIALLVAINAGHWILAGETGEEGAHERNLLAQDFVLHVDVQSEAARGRDLFGVTGGDAGWRGASGGFGERSVPARRKALRRVALAPASAPDAAQVMAQNSLSRLRLLGVVFHGGRQQAYLAQDSENSIAAAGDTVFGQYSVDDITIDAVTLRDTKTNLTRRIPVSGKQ